MAMNVGLSLTSIGAPGGWSMQMTVPKNENNVARNSHRTFCVFHAV